MRSNQSLLTAALIFACTVLACPLLPQSPSQDDEYVRRAPITARGLAPGMRVKQLGNAGRTFEVTLRKGDEVAAGLTEFAEQNHVTLAHVTAVGALNQAVLGWFDPDKRAYKKIAINQEVEVVSFIGNIALENGKPFLHAHAVVAFLDGSTKGGHFIEGHVSLEMQIFVVDSDAASDATTAAATPIPRVTGPLPVTSDSYPFGAADHTRVPSDLSKDGYLEEEFLISGTANVYDWPRPGPAIVRTSNVPYTTRVLVRRPADRAKFSGTVAVEMLNPSNSFDLNLGWTNSGKQFARHGDAWVGITAKPVSVVALKNFNPSRYAPLAWTNPLPLDDPKNCLTVPRDSDRLTENGLVWDIYSQTAAWLRSRERSNPLAYGEPAGGELPVQRLYAWGYSQTGSFLYTYVDAIHPLDVQANGRPLFDGYLIAMASGPSPINQCAAPIPNGDPRREIKNAGVPVIRVMSGSDYLRTIGARRPDGDNAPDLFRNYEIAGSAHATPDELNFAAAPADILKAGRAVPPMSCNEGPRSRFPNGVAFNAIFQNLDLWVRQGIAPPRSEPIRVENNAPVLDQFGNVTGGVRSPYVDVPTSTWSGNSTGESFCVIAGHEVPFDRVRLKQLYPTHGDYERAVAEDVSELVTQRYITTQDGKYLIEEAKKADVP
jgi:predicted DNA-binding protein with PD1-like motif